MDIMTAFAMGEANRDKELKVFDWHKAAELIRDQKPETVSAGLSGDWEHTGGMIFLNGEPAPSNETYVYLASTWATPEIKIDGKVQPCFKMQKDTDSWDAETYWPESAIKILKTPTQ